MVEINISSLDTLTFVGFMMLLAAAIVFAGIALTREADRIGAAYQFSAGLVGAVLLGATTSLPGTVVSVTAAAAGNAPLAVSNAVGGIAVQTAFLAIADMLYRRGNLEHAAASITTVMQCAMLTGLLALPLMAMATPEGVVFGIHINTIAMLAAYGAGLRLINRAEARPMWVAKTVEEGRSAPEESGSQAHQPNWPRFLFLAAVICASGYMISHLAGDLGVRTGLTASAVGALLTAVITSLPELVTAIAAVRRGALTLAVGSIIGGNTYDVLFLAFSDLAYRGGSIYSALDDDNVFLIAMSITMASILLLGLMKREQSGPANIGFESVTILALYGVTVVRLVS